MPPVADIALPLTLSFGTPSLLNQRRLYRNNAVSLTYCWQEQTPNEVSATGIDPALRQSLDWISFANELLPNSRAMTAEEKSSVEELFWAQFG